jgi:hypothetical protein
MGFFSRLFGPTQSQRPRNEALDAAERLGKASVDYAEKVKNALVRSYTLALKEFYDGKGTLSSDAEKSAYVQTTLEFTFYFLYGALLEVRAKTDGMGLDLADSALVRSPFLVLACAFWPGAPLEKKQELSSELEANFRKRADSSPLNWRGVPPDSVADFKEMAVTIAAVSIARQAGKEGDSALVGKIQAICARVAEETCLFSLAQTWGTALSVFRDAPV